MTREEREELRRLHAEVANWQNQARVEYEARKAAEKRLEAAEARKEGKP